MRHHTAAGLHGEGRICVDGDVLSIEGRRVRMWLCQLLAALGFFGGFALSIWLAVATDVDPDAVELWQYPMFLVAFVGLWVGGWLGRTLGGTTPVSLRIPSGGAGQFRQTDSGELAFQVAHELEGVVFFSPASCERQRFRSLCRQLGCGRRSR